LKRQTLAQARIESFAAVRGTNDPIDEGQTQPFDNPRQNVRLQRPGAAHFRCGKRETAKAAADAHETNLAFLHDLVTFRHCT